MLWVLELEVDLGYYGPIKPNPSLACVVTVAKACVNVYDYLLLNLSTSKLPICLHKKLKHL